MTLLTAFKIFHRDRRETPQFLYCKAEHLREETTGMHYKLISTLALV